MGALADVARALVRLHSTGHIHRDVKARNVLVRACRVVRSAAALLRELNSCAARYLPTIRWPSWRTLDLRVRSCADQAGTTAAAATTRKAKGA